MTPPLRVLLVGQAPTTPGGMSSVQRLHEAALRRRDDVEVHVAVTYAETGRAPRLRGVAGVLGAVGVLARRRVDVVDLHVSKGLSTLRKGVVVRAARALGIPSVLHVHAGAFGGWFDGLPRPLRALVAALLRADRVIALSDDAREVYARRLRVPRADVLVAANPVDRPATVPVRGPTDRVDAVFLGRLIDRKGVFDLLEAVAGLDGPLRDRLRLVVAGHGDADAVRLRVALLGLEQVVEVRSWLGPEDRDALLARARLLLLPSWWEALPMAVLEAMAWGVVPVVTPVGGLADLVRDGENGVVVPLRDPPGLTRALARLLLDDDRRAALGARAREDVRGYGADAWAEALVELYRAITVEPGRVGGRRVGGRRVSGP